MTGDGALQSGPAALTPLSVVIAVHNEAENVGPVIAELAEALAGIPGAEAVFVDDGSSDGTADHIAAARAALPPGAPVIRALRLDRRCGKTAALRAGIAAARGDWIATMDGDGQNDPRDVAEMYALGSAAAGPAPLVAGTRSRRHDGPWRLIATRFANGFRRRVLGDECPDSGCGLKAFRRVDFLELPGFEGMHRFLPALFQLYGHPLLCKPVNDRPRLGGRSKYTNFGRAMVGIGDMLGVVWLRSRTRRPGQVTEL